MRTLFHPLLCALLLSLTLAAPLLGVAASTPSLRPAVGGAHYLKANSRTQKLPKGTVIKLTVAQTIDSRTTRVGEAFTALVNQDVVGQQGALLLPVGSSVRGRVVALTPQRFFGRGATLVLQFDTTTLPSGLEKPIALQVTALTEHYKDGTLSDDPGYGAKMAKTADASATTISTTTQKGMDWGKSWGGVGGKIVMAPLGVIGGSLMGAGQLVGGAVYHAVAKGDPTRVTPQQVLFCELAQDTELPVAE
jgi:hypothetical protein